MRRWIDPQPVENIADLQAKTGGHILLAQTLARRGFSNWEKARAFLDPDAYSPAPAEDLPGLDRAVDRLVKAIQAQEPICVWGDFDVDGQTSTALLVSTLRDLGACVTYHIPVRARESHGVTPAVLSEIIDRGSRLILTCDTGIGAVEAGELARQRQVEMIVTDHHELPEQLPKAYALVNPKFLAEDHPLRTLPGVGVAYQVARALYARLGRGAEVEKHLDLVALGLVADLATLTGDARYLLQKGLKVLRETNRLGLLQMFELAEINPTNLSEEHIAFLLAPRLNALGRLADANLAVEFLTTTEKSRARILAVELEGLNARRKLLTDQVFKAAQAQIERDRSLLDLPGLVLAHPTWPAGIIGIVASRLVECYRRPVILIASPPGEPARGSARSIEGCNVTAAIAAQQDLLLGFGGHPMAAGLSLPAEKIPDFQRAFARTIGKMLAEHPVEDALAIDAYLPLADITLNLVEDLDRLGPFGPGNPALVLAARNLILRETRPIGRSGEHLQVTIQDETGEARRVLWWQGAGVELPVGAFDLAFTARASNYRGQRDVQMEWLEARSIAKPVAEIGPSAAKVVIHDYRMTEEPERLLEELASKADTLVWREGKGETVAGVDRVHLSPASEMVIWSVPPGWTELVSALQQVSPKVIDIFARDAGQDQAQAFVTHLAGMVKYALNNQQGKGSLERMAAATGQQVAAVRAGLNWLTAKGLIKARMGLGDEVEVEPGDGKSDPGLPEVEIQLRECLAETAAFRAYYRHVDADLLFQSWNQKMAGKRRKNGISSMP